MFHPPPPFFVKLTVQEYLNDVPVGEPTEVELQGSGELTQCMIKSYLTLDYDPETGELSGACITSIVCGELCTSIGDLYNGWGGSCVESEDEVMRIERARPFLQTLIIPNSVSSISGSAFDGCVEIKFLYIGSAITNINAVIRDIDYIGLSDVEVDAANTVYDSRNNCNAIIETATNTLIKGSDAAFIPNDITSIGNNAFFRCHGLSSITIPDSVTSIGNSAFTSCYSLTSITIPNGITSIDNQTFSGCRSLTSVTIPNSVTSIGVQAFNGCTAMTSINIPSGVTSIDSQGFVNCTSLSAITSFATTAPTIANNTFMYIKTGGTLYVPQGSSGYDTWMNRLSGWTKVEQ